MSLESELMNQIINLKQDRLLYTLSRKSLFYRQLLIYFSLVYCRILTVEQLMLLIDADSGQENILRKDLSRFITAGHILKEPFKYCGRFAAYSLTKNGLDWLIEQLPVLISSHKDDSLTEYTVKKNYKDRRKDRPSDHLVCINQIRLGLICGASAPLALELKQERPLITNRQAGYSTPKTEGQLIPDLMVQSHGLSVFFEADTTSVTFYGSRGPAEKIAKYSMICDPYSEKYSCGQSHILFSIQKNMSDMKAATSSLSASEVRIFGNPERINQALTVIRLLAALNNCQQKQQLATVVDMMEYLKKYAPFLGDALQKSPLIHQTSLLLSGLIRMGYGDCSIENVRKGIAAICSAEKEERSRSQISGALLAAEKRKAELFHEIIASRHIYRSCQHGMSISCLCSHHLSWRLPLVLPMVYFTPADIRERLIHFGILTHRCSPITSYPSFPCRKVCEKPEHKEACWQYDTVMNNAFLFDTGDGSQLLVCIENVSDDISGFLRVQKYLQLPPGFQKNILLLILICDDLILADGKSVYEGGLYYDAYRKEIPCFLNPDTGLADKNSLHVLNHYVGQRPDSSMPFMFGITQDYTYLTYSDFVNLDSSSGTRLFIPGKNDVIYRHGQDTSHFSICNYQLTNQKCYLPVDFTAR